VIILGILLLIIGFVAGIAILWTIGIVVVIIGVVLALLGMAGHAGTISSRWPGTLPCRSGRTASPSSAPGAVPVNATLGLPSRSAGSPAWQTPPVPRSCSRRASVLPRAAMRAGNTGP
jgi:hypothetical protein